MALAWRPLDEQAIGRVLALADTPWGDLDDAWASTGWELPGGVALSHQVFEELEYRFDLPEGPVRFGADETALTSASLDFAWFAPDPEDVQEGDWPQGWQHAEDASRADFTARYAEGVAALTAVLGEPERTGGHDEELGWQHALWRRGEDTVVVVAQGEQFDQYGESEAALLWVVRHRGEVPDGEEFYEWLCGAGE